MINVYIFGDSNVRSFFGKQSKIINEKIIFHNLYKSKVSMKGLNNGNSISNYKQEIIDFISSNNNINDYYVFKFGQVDIEYVLNYKKFIKNEDVVPLQFFEQIINNYFIFLKNLNIKNIIVCSTNLPNQNTILKNIQESIGLKVDITISELSKNCILFNQILKEYCNKNNTEFLDFIELLGEKKDDYLILKPIFIGTDHHICGCEYIYNLNKQLEINSNYGKNVNDIFLKMLIDKILVHST